MNLSATDTGSAGEPSCEFLRPHHEGSMRTGCGDDLVIGTDHRTVRSIFPGESLYDLIGPFTPLGVDHLYS